MAKPITLGYALQIALFLDLALLEYCLMKQVSF